ncbi:FAD-dependent oxidoreductase [Duganella violaceipulchra]|uniref:FAD-binding protein n=1 Tax=Duganella violaceipulchra TaxID=2849652 RepID=A0AA41L0L2_9BURK|nr:FAD-binding protein [Duganella violaceicalia]MBV6323006.1 FAD-binding protein [Duganella violaceicalia]MCP2010209.1 FAD/FMN-containing dehydrogenase [Duganella violaceicalia]
MKRRSLLKSVAALPLMSLTSLRAAAATARRRLRPGDAAWPSATAWQQLKERVDGRLLKLDAPFAACAASVGGASAPACTAALDALKNTYAIGDQPALTQTSGWQDAWSSQPSAYAVVARGTADVVAAVNFAREHNLRLVVKGGGHSYQGTSDAPDSLLVWTRQMNDATLQPAFVAQGCSDAPQAAVTLGAGAMWTDAYDAVTTRGGRYVQGGGCTTVGVAGLVQSGGFGSFSKNYGTAAAGLLEAEVVTADGQVRIANACTNPELFWALKGGGGGSVGVVTRLTLRTRELPETFGAVFFTIKAASDDAYRALIAQVLAFYAGALFNANWGEQIGFNTGNTVDVSMVFQGLNQQQAEAVWAPFLAWLGERPEYTLEKPFRVVALPARQFWNLAFFKKYAPGFMLADERPGAPAHHGVWKGDADDAGWFIHGYQSAWLPATLLAAEQQAQLADALFRSTRHWRVGLHFNKGLAGASAADLAAARDTAMNPDVLGAFALAIIAGGDGPRYPGMPDANEEAEKGAQRGRERAASIGRAMAELRKAAPKAGSYVSESDYFLKDWQGAFWGANYERLARAKRQYDPHGLFFVRHGVGSEDWSDDGFTRKG